MKYIIVKFFIISILGWGGMLDIYAQSRQIVFRKITVEDGLSQNSVISIAQDTIGMMWLATQDGMNKYNGINFEKYPAYFYDITRPNFSRLGKIYIDVHQNIWSLTSQDFINRFSPVDYTVVTFKDVKAPNTILEYGDNRLLVGTWGYGIYEYYPSSSQFLPVKGPLSFFNRDTLFTMHEDRAGILWFGTQRGLYSYNGDSIRNWTLDSRDQETVHPFIGSIDDHPDGTVWLGSYGDGLYYKKSETEIFTKFVPKKSVAVTSGISYDKLNVLDLMVDYKNRLWIATYGQGLFLFDGENPLQNFQNQRNNPNSISYNDILTLYEDKNHVIWAGTDGGGASYYDENLHKFNVFTNPMVPPDINVDVVRALLVDAGGSVWLGTSGKGLTRYSPGTQDKWHTYRASERRGEGPGNDRIVSLAEDQDGDIWIGTQGRGLDIYSRSTGQFRNYYQSMDIRSNIPDHTVWCITPVDQGTCWLGTRNAGLILFDKFLGVLEHYLPDSSDQSISSRNIRTVIRDHNEGLWIGTDDHGVCYLDFATKNFRRYTSNDSLENVLSSNYIKSLHLDSLRKILWVGTAGGGLNALHLESGIIDKFSMEDGLPNNVIYGILADKENNLWMSTNRGLCKFTPSSDTTSDPQILVYDNYDGLQGLEFNTGAYFKDSEGFLYFGGINGYNWFKPEEIEFNSISPNTTIIGIDINDRSYVPDTVLEKKNQLLLSYDQDAISFHFSSLSYSMPERNMYQYRLDGYDENWINAGFRNFASYTNLDPGDYTFLVKGSNYDGEFDVEPASIHIVIKPPWWGTFWAYSIYGFLIIIFAFGGYKFQKRRWQLKAALAFEHREAERLKELDEFKSRVYANITHEFRTPLTVIQGLIERVRDYARKDRKDQFSELIEIVQRNGERLLKLVNQMLDLSRLESKSLHLDYVSGDIVAYIKYGIELFESYANSQGIGLYFNTGLNTFTMDFDPENLQKILNNLISNAIKFTPHGGGVSVELDHVHLDQKDLLRIQIQDTGIGIPENEIPFIFDRFYQASHTQIRHHEGSGIGLALTKELIHLMEGDIQIKSEVEQGTTFIIHLPVFHQAIKNYTKVENQRNEEKPQSSSDILQPESTLDEPRILLIEDNKDVLHYLKICLIERFTILEAVHGSQGIALAFEQVPDLIITDVMMPGMDGFEVCDKLKNDPRTSHIPVIMLTAKATLQDKITGLKAGADAYLVKPFNVDELTAQVENLLTIRKKLQEKFNHIQEKGSFENYATVTEKLFLDKLNGFIEKELINPELSVEKICDEMHMSRTQLHRKIKALTDRSITAYVRRYKLIAAQELIRKTDKTISEIAYETGFNDPSYFHRSFQKEFGIRPGDIRNTGK